MKVKVFCAVACAAVAALCSGTAATAAYVPHFDPLSGNVPYLAWRGEELRLVKCVDVRYEGADLVKRMNDADGSGRLNADWLVEDWSGYPFQPPQLEPSTVKFFRGNNEYRGDLCVKADFVSLKAGLAQIKLVVSDARSGDPLLKHQFLAGWLSLNTPTIREVASTTTPGGGGVLGDPTGDGVFYAGGDPGRVQVFVTGHLPLDNNFRELGLPAAGINLPTEPNGDTYWDDLARAMATTSDPTPLYRDAPWRIWDIHDDQAPTEGHVNPVGACGENTVPTLIDAVDACLGAVHFIGDGEYTRLFGDRSAAPTFGPFDPLRPDETLLSDGKLDAGDVPMPSALVEVGIAPNTGAPTDLGGVGSLAIVDPSDGVFPYIGVFKCIPYTRDNKCTNLGTGDPDGNLHHPPTIPNVAPPPYGVARHNHYAPYYSRWIPATFATVGSSLDEGAPFAREASGNDGPPIGNNFPGYRGSGLYDYWQFADVLTIAQDGPTHCLRRLTPEGPDYRRLPVGPQRVMVFSDEHGEAQVYFNPGLGFFFDNLVTPNLNGGCDLRGITELGHADITAIARYPYQKVTDPDKPSTTIRKTVNSRFDKSVSCVPKGPTPPIENSLAFICTATAIDIDGSPIVNEKVCFMTGQSSEGMREFPLGRPHVTEGVSRLCVWTDAHGQASVEVFGKCGAGNVIVEFVDEGIIRVATFTFGCPTPGTPAAAGSAIPPNVAPGSITPPATPQQIQQAINQASSPAGSQNNSSSGATLGTQAKASKATLAIARIQKKAFAKNRYVVVRVNGVAKTARIQVTVLARHGKVLRKVTRVVRTNRTVQVPNLKLPTKAVAARVRVLS
jgi:hypothetical protein